MTATNHVLTGAAIAAAIQKPIVALPLALLSHFVCDAIPHLGNVKSFDIKTRNYARFLAADCTLAAAILLFIFLSQPAHWLLLIACGIIASSPDLMWLPHYIRVLLGKKRVFATSIERFHRDIQWSETPKGAIVEIIWFVVFGSAIFSYCVG